MGGDIFDILCCICSCVCDEDSNNCCIGTVGCLGILCASYQKNISGNSQRRFKFLNKLIIFIFSIIAIVLSTITVVEFNSTTFNFSSIFQNWKLGAIVDIKVQNNCDNGYETLSIYESPKSVKGCICSDDISSGDCSDYEFITGCAVKAPQDPLVINSWVQKGNDTYYKTQICGKRSKLTFYELIEKQIITEQDCIDNGYKVCKTNNIENSYCVSQDEECPIRGFQISEVELNDEEILLKNYEKIYDQGFYTYVTRNLDIFPIINVAIVKGQGVCLDEDEISLNARLEEDYELLDPSPSNCELDDSFQNIAEITEVEFFDQNGVFNTIQLAWPHYEISKNIVYKLMMQNQIQYKLQCRKSNFESLNQIADNLDSLKSILICQTVFAYIFFCIMTFLLHADLLRVCYEDCKCIKKYLYLILQLTSLYLMSVTIIVSFSYIEYIKPKIQNEFDKGCFQKSSQSKLKFILDQINNKGQTLTSSLFMICIIVIVIDFIMETFVCFKKVKKLRFDRTQRTIDQYNNNNEIPQQNPFSNQEQNMYHNQQPNVNSYGQPNVNQYQYPDDKQNFQNQQNYNPYQIPNQANYNYPQQNNNYTSDNQYNLQNQQNQNNKDQDSSQLIQF